MRSFARISRGHGERKELSKSCIATTSRTGSHRILSIATMLCMPFPLSHSFFIFWTAQLSLIYTFFYILDLKRYVRNLSVAQDVFLISFCYLYACGRRKYDSFSMFSNENFEIQDCFVSRISSIIRSSFKPLISIQKRIKRPV